MDFFRSRNFLLSMAVLTLCLIITGIFAIYKQKEFEDASLMLDNTHAVIYETQDLSNKILSLIPNRRAYLLTENDNFNDRYLKLQNEISTDFESLIEEVGNSPLYTKRVLELEGYYLDLVVLLDSWSVGLEQNLEDTEQVEALKENIRNVRNALLDSKYTVMNDRIQKIGTIQERMIAGLLIGIFSTGLILTLLNYFLFRLRRQNRLMGKDLFNSEERLQYAMLASGEGVFDWDIESNYVYFSRSFVDMLGYEVMDFKPTIESLKNIIHEDDVNGVMDYADQYINDDLSEYSIEFRMKNANGHYIWVNSRAYALRDETGKALRLIGVHRDISDHKMVEENLEKEALSAEQSSSAKSEFLAHMSHEIRTPLTAITGISEILLKKKDDFNDRQKELLNTLSSSAKSLKELVNDILDFSKIEKGEIEMENEHFLLGNLIGEIISIMSVPAQEKGLNFNVHYDDVKYYEYYGDEGRIKQILLNLIGNAVKFTDKGAVTIMATIEEIDDIECLVFSVQDTGIGIEEKMLDHIFLEFRQEDSSISRRYGGTGLGLPISKKLSQLMGGDIKIQTLKGLGSTFTLFLPVKDRGLKLIDGADLNLQEKMTDKLSSLIQEQQCALIVEDYEGNIVILSYLMEEINLNFDVARTGVEALEMWKSKHYDIVLMDVQMPEMDGMTATKEIRAMETDNGFEATPIIGMTAHALIQDKDKCIESGMTDYVSKPINNDLLKDKILKYINQDKLEQKKTGTH